MGKFHTILEKLQTINFNENFIQFHAVFKNISLNCVEILFNFKENFTQFKKKNTIQFLRKSCANFQEWLPSSPVYVKNKVYACKPRTLD